MEQVKRKRGRPRKNPLPQEVQDLVDKVKKAKLEEPLEPSVPESSENTLSDAQWTFPKDYKVEFFDTRCSYELTGYKPINDKQGLDFDPDWFTEARRTFERTGHYCGYLRNSKFYGDFWDREYLRCMNGMTSHGYTVTGDHYFFLNYYQLQDLTNTAKAGAGRNFIFPQFYVVQYEFFHYIELCKVLRKNAALMKARGVGQL